MPRQIQIWKCAKPSESVRSAVKSQQQVLNTVCKMQCVCKMQGVGRTNDVRALLALPARLGGLGIVNPAVALTKEHTDSKEICQPLTDLIIQQKPDLADTSSVVQKRRRAVQERRARLTAEAAASLTSTLPENLQRAVEIASDQGA